MGAAALSGVQSFGKIAEGFRRIAQLGILILQFFNFLFAFRQGLFGGRVVSWVIHVALLLGP